MALRFWRLGLVMFCDVYVVVDFSFLESAKSWSYVFFGAIDPRVGN